VDFWNFWGLLAVKFPIISDIMCWHSCQLYVHNRQADGYTTFFGRWFWRET